MDDVKWGLAYIHILHSNPTYLHIHTWWGTDSLHSNSLLSKSFSMAIPYYSPPQIWRSPKWPIKNTDSYSLSLQDSGSEIMGGVQESLLSQAPQVSGWQQPGKHTDNPYLIQLKHDSFQTHIHPRTRAHSSKSLIHLHRWPNVTWTTHKSFWCFDRAPACACPGSKWCQTLWSSFMVGSIQALGDGSGRQ